MTARTRRRLHPATRIFVGLAAGAVLGVTANAVFGRPEWLEWAAGRVFEPVGQMWLRALIMIVLPLVFASLALGVAGLGDLRKLGRVGAKTFAFFLTCTIAAAVVGITLVQLIRPGDGMSEETRVQLVQTYASQAAASQEAAQKLQFDVSLLVNIVPKNPVKAMVDFDMLAVIFFSLMFGLGLALLPAERAAPMVRFLESLGHVVSAIIDLVMKAAPLGVFALIFAVTARFGHELLLKLGWYVLTVLLGLAIQMVVVYPLLVRFLARLNPWTFLRRIETVLVTAFSTSSSSATLPTSLRVAEEEVGVPREVAGFVLPLGATMNMNGTALFEGVTVLFIAQVFGVELSLGAQAAVVLMSVLMAVGSAGVPSGSLPLLVLVLEMVGVPGEGIAIILGADRLLDMCRTTVNVAGDVTAATWVARSEGYALVPRPKPAEPAEPAGA
jgi:DAACS family dicarboxylate/amino acid:cation (Na+ or H+) symporter